MRQMLVIGALIAMAALLQAKVVAELADFMIMAPVPPPPPPAPSPPPPEPPPPSPPQAPPPNVRSGLGVVTRFKLDRHVLDRFLEDGANARRAPIAPALERGRVVGIRLLRVQSRSLGARFGFRTGDVIETVNGFEIATPEKALEAYARLRSADILTVSLRRRGVPLVFVYEIQ